MMVRVAVTDESGALLDEIFAEGAVVIMSNPAGSLWAARARGEARQHRHYGIGAPAAQRLVVWAAAELMTEAETERRT